MNAQGVTSPFDLIPKLERNVLIDSSAHQNPFNIVESPDLWPPAASPGFSVEKKRPLTLTEKNAIYHRFLLFAVLAMCVILALLVSFFRNLLGKIWKAFLNDNLLYQLQREQVSGYTVAYFLFYLMFLMNAGLFIFLGCRLLGIALAETNVTSLFMCIGGLAGFFLVKHALLQITGFIFPVKKEVSTYNFTIVVFNIIIALFLVPVIFFMSYTLEPLAISTLYVGLATLALILLFRSLRGLFIANRFIAWHKFHFLLYLCAVEIAPILIVTKLLILK